MAPQPPTHIQLATEADADAIAAIHYAALEQFHDFYATFFERHPRDILPLSTRLALKNPKNRFLIAVVPGTHAVVGFIRYHVVDATEPPAATTLAKPTESADTEPTVPFIFSIKPHMKEMWERFGHPREEEMDECYEKAVDGRRHNYVKNIMVDPNHQRKGIGASLLKAVIDISDDEKIPTFLVASAEGYGLYKKLGFEDLGTWTIDNDYWSEKIVQHENELGIVGNEGLAETYRGTHEVEKYMMRWIIEE
ncbi:acyl-CoA N-acyltransferase [Colletotrichum godetiae]|uniref:Acyl-CoA N-acyltransferase n=1 Tax=Colletotrichum godetiae TaxID=1209918 RepID=A0AAJ0AEI1_9PEZI|nr:acyl-CoA N-acyltransferase [Colletotrichum godetiae]KAK1670993.1 acyl-CoA N-acyltransferase [Colletotrichum godetiae]